MILSYVNILVNSFKKRGIINTINFILYELLFDYIHKVQTKGYMELSELDISQDRECATKYQGSNYYILNKFFNKYKNVINNRTIVDFGSGKGRILILAMKYGAKSCIGVEFAKELIDISRVNLDLYKANNNLRTEIVLINDSALNYDFNGAEDVLFFYNPFNEKILNPIIEKILQLNNRPIIVYINPVHKELFDTAFEEIDNFDNELIVYQQV